MFNGIVYNIGIVKVIKKQKKSYLIGINTNLKFSKKDLGSSISCSGVCLTLIKVEKKIIYFYLSNETIKRSNFKYISVGDVINLEKSLIFGQRISGHFTQGHVDTTAIIEKISILHETWILKCKIVNKSLSKYLIEKASISINGVSLTLSKVRGNKFQINIIPHTLKLTNLKNLKVNDLVNVELDIFAKYIYKYSL